VYGFGRVRFEASSMLHWKRPVCPDGRKFNCPWAKACKLAIQSQTNTPTQDTREDFARNLFSLLFLPLHFFSLRFFLSRYLPRNLSTEFCLAFFLHYPYLLTILLVTAILTVPLA